MEFYIFMDIQKQFGARVRELRARAGLTQAELAQRCGNGVLDPAEECDDGGESATCDADCTFAECGDETRNAAAGEACDGDDDEKCNGLSCRPDCTCRLSKPLRAVPAVESVPPAVLPDMVLVPGGEFQMGNPWSGGDPDELPVHTVYLSPYYIDKYEVTNEQYSEFVKASGARPPESWGIEAIDAATFAFGEEQGKRREDAKQSGEPVPERETFDQTQWWRDNWQDAQWEIPKGRETFPVRYVDYQQAGAYARWAGARLPTEAEWEVASESLALEGNFVEDEVYHPRAATEVVDSKPQQMFGDVWEWTASQYTAYPGYKPPAGALGEYNGKFMCNQMVLRGGSCATPRSHLRASYRNFFYPDARWQFSGIRLARDA